jgi:gliding motility-associated-like protein
MRYTLTATTGSGCKGVDEVNVKVYKGPEIYVPTAFTPNNDGLNDILKAIPVGIKEFRYFVVYNRWGQRVFYTNDANKGWDGKLSGTEQGNDSFIWMAEGVDDGGNKVVRKGTVVIVR